MVSCLMGDSTALASAIVRCCPSVTSSARAVIGRVVRIIITDRIHAIGFLNLFILSQILS